MGAIAYEDGKNRNLIMKSGFINLALQVPRDNSEYYHTLIWTLTNMCIMKEYCNYCDLRDFLPVFISAILNNSQDVKLVSDSLSSLSILACNLTYENN